MIQVPASDWLPGCPTARTRAVAATKALIRDVAGESPKDVIGLTTGRIAAQRVSPEGQEGMRAFLQKRKPNWSL